MRYLVAILACCLFGTLLAAETQTEAKSADPAPAPQNEDLNGSRVYLKIGGALLFDERRVVPEPAFGLGYRYEEGMLMVDLSFFNETIGPTLDWRDYNEEIPYERNKLHITTTRWANLSFCWIAEPASWQSFYGGGGLAVETLDLELGDDISSKTGLAATLIVGWEFLRDRKVMILTQIEAVLPLYAGHFEGDTFWVPSLTLTVGAGF